MTRRMWAALVVGLCAASVTCTVTDEPVVATVADVPHALPASTTPVLGTVTDSRQVGELLVELSDPSREEHIWVSGFPRAPGRGEQVWTAIAGPPVAHDLVGVVYPSLGFVEPPARTTHVTRRSALAAVVGAAFGAVALVALVVLASGWARRSGYRRCGGCSAPVESEWLTCPRCGRSLAPPAMPETPPEELTLGPGVPELFGGEGAVEESARPTRITRNGPQL